MNVLLLQKKYIPYSYVKLPYFLKLIVVLCKSDFYIILFFQMPVIT